MRSMGIAVAWAIALCVVGGSSWAAEVELPATFARDSRVTVNPRTRVPEKVIGLGARPAALANEKGALTQKRAGEVFKSFLADHYAFFRVKPEELAVRSVTRRGDTWFVKYQQQFKGIPVEGATVGLTASADGTVRSYGSSYVPELSVPVEPKITLEQAVARARATYQGGRDRELSVKESAKIVHVVRDDSVQRTRLAWKLLLAGARPDVDLDAWFVVDALDGAILKQVPRVFPDARIYGRVTGDEFPVNPTAPPMATEPLEDAHVQVEWGGTRTTNASGDFTANLPWYSFLKSRYDVTFRLRGPYAEVGDYGTNAVFEVSRTCRKDQRCDQHWADPDPDGSSVFFHINALHDWYRDRLEYEWTNPWQGNGRFRALVNRAWANAHAGDPMVFGNDPYARSSDVVYHECTHNVLYAIFGDWVGFSNGTTNEGYAFDEGFADYFAGALTGDPRHGEGYGGTRTLSNTRQYGGKAGYSTEGHTGGTIIGGAAWDLRDRFRATLGDGPGALAADVLAFDALHQMAAMPSPYFFSDPQESNFLTSAYLADDDDGNLANGTPHFWDIQRAFAVHDLLKAVLLSQDSYDVSANAIANVTGGDFYFLQGAFWSNNSGQRGVQDLGDVGATSLDDVQIPASGYTRQRVPAVAGHTYVALAQQGEEGRHVVFRVDSVAADGSEVAITYRYRAPMLVDPIALCERFPFLCQRDLCSKIPPLCDPVVVLPDRGRITFPVRDRLDRVVIPVQKICQYVVSCPGCGPGGLCPGLDVTISANPDPLQLEIVNVKGDVVARGEQVGGGSRLHFDARDAQEYLLVVKPEAGSRVGVEYTLGVASAGP